MAKATKVQTCDDGCKSESDSDDGDEPTKDELIDMLEDAKTLISKVGNAKTCVRN